MKHILERSIKVLKKQKLFQLIYIGIIECLTIIGLILFILYCILNYHLLITNLPFFQNVPNNQIFDGQLSFDANNDRIAKQLMYRPKKVRNDELISIYHHKGQYLGFRATGDCPNQRCFVTNKLADFNHSQIVIFTPDNNDSNDIFERLYKQKRPNQAFILQLQENPENSGDLRMYNGKINFTSSYRWDADFVEPYGRYVKNKLNYYYKNKQYSKTIETSKKSRVAFFVSNCLTRNNRHQYADQISMYYPVDKFGKCGEKTVNRHDGYQLLKNNYKYYLAFENGNCRDYVTEKFFINALQNQVIPIVLGPSIDFYKKISPPNSFIHVSQFKNAHALVEYLKYLDRNSTAYQEYFEWNNYGSLVGSKYWCRICNFAQDMPNKIYHDIENWWKQKGDCNNQQSQWGIAT